MTEVLFFVAYLVTWYLSLEELKRFHPKEFEKLGGDKVYFWPPSQQMAQAYFLVLSYTSIWEKAGRRKWCFVANTLLGWFGLIWIGFFFYGLFINT